MADVKISQLPSASSVTTSTTLPVVQSGTTYQTTVDAIGNAIFKAESPVAIGPNAGNTNQGPNTIGIGNYAASSNQGFGAVAIGSVAGETSQGVNATAVGPSAGGSNQGASAVALGFGAGSTTQGTQSIAVGISAGSQSQSANSVAIGSYAAFESQGNSAVAIGSGAGQSAQGQTAVAIGLNAGQSNQGQAAVAIGQGAGTTNQASNSIVINASGSTLNASTTGLFAAPLRNLSTSQGLYYNTTTKEITYDTAGGGGNVDLGNVSQDIVPMFSEVYDIGSSSKLWFDGFFANSISLGNVVISNDSGVLTTNNDVVISGTLLIDNILIYDNIIIPTGGSEYEGNAGVLIVDGSIDSSTGDWLRLPNGTTAARPATGELGMLRYNTTTQGFEGYSTTGWGAIGGGGVTSITAGTGITVNQSTGAVTVSATAAPLTYSVGTAVGDGTTVAFTISSGRTANDILVFVNGICFTPTDDYTVSGTTLTFASAPAEYAEITFRYLPI
jgi:hypothetical protein